MGDECNALAEDAVQVVPPILAVEALLQTMSFCASLRFYASPNAEVLNRKKSAPWIRLVKLRGLPKYNADGGVEAVWKLADFSSRQMFRGFRADGTGFSSQQ